MVTLCCEPLDRVRRNLVDVDDRAGRVFFTVRVKLHGSKFCSQVVIDPDCNYVVRYQHGVDFYVRPS